VCVCVRARRKEEWNLTHSAINVKAEGKKARRRYKVDLEALTVDEPSRRRTLIALLRKSFSLSKAAARLLMSFFSAFGEL
jgi:hypothetical protein